MLTVEQTIREIVLKNAINKNIKICDETNLIEDIGMDSISLMMMVIAIEERYDIQLPDEFLTEKFLSKYSQLVSVVEKIVNPKNQ